MRLIDAKLCSDCDCVYDEEIEKVCPTCTSKQGLRLEPILNRTGE